MLIQIQNKPKRRHPDWLKVKLPSGTTYNYIKSLVNGASINIRGFVGTTDFSNNHLVQDNTIETNIVGTSGIRLQYVNDATVFRNIITMNADTGTHVSHGAIVSVVAWE